MAKLISVSNDVYETLTRLKGEGSYSQVIRFLFEKRGNKDRLLSFFGKGGIDGRKIKETGSMWKKWSKEYA